MIASPNVGRCYSEIESRIARSFFDTELLCPLDEKSIRFCPEFAIGENFTFVASAKNAFGTTLSSQFKKLFKKYRSISSIEKYNTKQPITKYYFWVCCVSFGVSLPWIRS